MARPLRSGPRVAAAALFGLAAGTLLGLLARRVLEAMGLTLLVTGVMTYLLECTHKSRLLVPPHTYTNAGSIPKPPMGEKWSAGHFGLMTASGRRDDVMNCPLPVRHPAQGVHGPARVCRPLLPGQPGRRLLDLPVD